MADGTLIPLHCKTHWSGDTYFDRRRNYYSVNVQIINNPNLKIIDYASGFTGSRHDTPIAVDLLARQSNLNSFWAKKNGAGVMPDIHWRIGLLFLTRSPQARPKRITSSILISLEFEYEANMRLVISRVDFNQLQGLRVNIQGPLMLRLPTHGL